MSVNLNVNTLKSTLSKVERGVNFVDFEAEVIIIGAGGRGGVYPSNGFTKTSCGGGAGSFLSASYTIPATSSLNIHVGLPGTGSLSGSYPGNVYRISRAEDSKISYYNPNTETYEDKYIARGGGAGESSPDGFAPGDDFPLSQIIYDPNPIEGYGIYDGGSGGGVFATASNQQPKTPRSKSIPVVIPDGEVLAFLFTGSIGGAGDVGTEGFRFREPAGGGGALQSGSKSRFMTQYPPGSGAGYNLSGSFLDDIIVSDVSQGAGFNLEAGTTYNPPQNRGWGGGISGSSGLVAIKYFGEQKIFGDAGQVITEEDYTIHIFTGSADITTTGKTFSGSDIDIPVPEIPVEAIILGGGGGYGQYIDVMNETTSSGGGGGAGAAVSGSFIMGRNTTFNIHIGSGSLKNEDGDNSFMYGFIGSENLDTYSTASSEITMSAYGGKTGTADIGNVGDGGNSGEGFYIIGDDIQYYPSFSGGLNQSGNVPGIPQQIWNAPGGGASNSSDGDIGGYNDPADITFGIGTTRVENSIIPYEGVTSDLSSNFGGGANGSPSNTTWGSGATTNGAKGTPGLLLFTYPQYYDRYDIQVTGNVTSSLRNGTRIHQFNIGDGTIRLNYSPTGST